MLEQEETTVVDSAETTTDNVDNYEINSATESEGETEQTKSDRQPETPEARRARIKRQYEREFGKEASKESPKEEVSDERYLRLELKTDGITSKKEQDIVIDYAKYKGIDVSEAMKSPVVKAELAEYRAKASVPPPTTNRTGTGASNSLEYWIKEARKGNFPRNDKEMMKQLAKARIFTK